jgi:hypothetical protein
LLGFVAPFFTLLWTPSKRNRATVAAICVSILISRLANTWLLVMPEFTAGTPFWLDVAAVCALGGGMVLLALLAMRHAHQQLTAAEPVWSADHG